ncbi:hypothetical protein HK099_008463 [Clydaea vesicula]|uniref:PAS domain-containing protein n=1 Tax=Clydaea vesicula TaxID=447962 RepID=A0AAD5U8G1_9FUNG|nr:hypothetical protein HK099_008463 [Clydaea vesicula]
MAELCINQKVTDIKKNATLLDFTNFSDRSLNENQKNLTEFVIRMNEFKKSNGVEGISRRQTEEVKRMTSSLCAASESIEEDIFLAENVVFLKSEHAFFLRENEAEYAKVRNRHLTEEKKLKAMHDADLNGRKCRKDAKKFMKDLNRASKLKDTKIHNQENAHRSVVELKLLQSQRHNRIEQEINHTIEKHTEQISQHTKLLEREKKDRKAILELQLTNASEERKIQITLDYQFQSNYHALISKNVLDHLRDQQTLELRQIKEKMALETKSMEAISTLKASSLLNYQKTVFEQKIEYYKEKDKIFSIIAAQKVIQIEEKNKSELEALIIRNRKALNQWKILQKQKFEKKMRLWEMVTGIRADNGKELAFQEENSLTCEVNNGQLNLYCETGDDKLEAVHNDYPKQLQLLATKNNELKQELQDLKKRHFNVLVALKQFQLSEMEEKQKLFQKEEDDLEKLHDDEIKKLLRLQKEELNVYEDIYKNELKIESQVRSVELKALQERKVLNEVFNCIKESVVSINPLGIILRFNSAAESMFNYSALEAVGKNVQMLMTTAHGHNEYLYKYLTTGKSNLGKDAGKKVFARKKEGTIFPMNILVTEVVEDGLRIFTAVCRDLTEVIEKENFKILHEKESLKRVSRLEEELKLEIKRNLNYIQIPKEILEEEKGKADSKHETNNELDIIDNFKWLTSTKIKKYESASLLIGEVVGLEEFQQRDGSKITSVKFLNDLYGYYDMIKEQFGLLSSFLLN